MNKPDHSPSRSPRPLPILLLLAAVVLLAINMRAPLVALGPVVNFIHRDLGVSGSFMGMIAALPMLAFALFSPLASKLAAKFGIENVLVYSLIMLLIGILIRSIWPAAWALTLGTAVLSAAIAMSNVLVPALAKRSLPSHISLVISTMSTTMSLAAAIAAASSVPLTQHHGWQWALGIWGVPVLIALAVWLHIRRISPEVTTQVQKSSGGLNVWRISASWYISLYMGMQSLMFYSLVNFLPSVLIEKGLTPVAAGAYISLLQISSLPGAIAVPTLFTRSRHRQSFSLFIGSLMLIGALGIWLAPVSTTWIWIVCAGLGTSGAFGASLMLFALRTDKTSEAASLSGMAQSVGYTVAIFGPLGMGMLYDLFGSWVPAMGALTALMTVECVMAWLAADSRTLTQIKSQRDNKKVV